MPESLLAPSSVMKCDFGIRKIYNDIVCSDGTTMVENIAARCRVD